jgi:porin
VTSYAGVAIFSRISKSMPSDRNLIDFYGEGGIVFIGMIPGRPHDQFGGDFIYSRISNSARSLDQDVAALTGMPRPIRNYELGLEVTYQAEILPGWSLQPDLQYVIHPGGNIPNPNSPTGVSAIKNAFIYGLRTTIQY